MDKNNVDEWFLAACVEYRAFAIADPLRPCEPFRVCSFPTGKYR
jgi:hypothetical protein